MNPLLCDALAAGRGVLARPDHTGLTNLIDVARRNGQLVSVLPGVYAEPASAGRLEIRCRAVMTADPAAVIMGTAAAILHGWDAMAEPEVVQAASGSLRSRRGFDFERRRVPARLTRNVRGIRITSRALTAVDLIPELGSGIVDQALRRHVPLHELRRALQLTPNRPGNSLRREVLADSRDQPWSPAERLAHRVMDDLDGFAALVRDLARIRAALLRLAVE